MTTLTTEFGPFLPRANDQNIRNVLTEMVIATGLIQTHFGDDGCHEYHFGQSESTVDMIMDPRIAPQSDRLTAALLRAMADGRNSSENYQEATDEDWGNFFESMSQKPGALEKFSLLYDENRTSNTGICEASMVLYGHLAELSGVSGERVRKAIAAGIGGAG